MRLITRADWDGLVSAVLLSTVEHIEHIQFAYPKDVQDGKVIVPENSIIANLPYHPNCALWFDHHSSEEEIAQPSNAFMPIPGRYAAAPSTARLIYEYYGGDTKLGRFKELVEATDRVDSAQLTEEDVLNPQGYVLLAFTMDPRSGLKDIELQMYFMMLLDWLKTKSLEEILEMPEVKTMTERLRTENERFREALLRHSRLDGNVVITDFRGLAEIPPGNRFLIYLLFPQANVSARLYDGKGGTISTIMLGHSIFNRTCKTNVGKLLAEYGGGGHKGAGTAQFPKDEAEPKFREIIARLKEAG
ncbi:MAG: exopolyphosphatase [Anaerolineales bacterium]|nr:exopolyphosphatase [Anaerolineales bacterium]